MSGSFTELLIEELGEYDPDSRRDELGEKDPDPESRRDVGEFLRGLSGQRIDELRERSGGLSGQRRGLLGEAKGDGASVSNEVTRTDGISSRWREGKSFDKIPEAICLLKAQQFETSQLSK